MGELWPDTENLTEPGRPATLTPVGNGRLLCRPGVKTDHFSVPCAGMISASTRGDMVGAIHDISDSRIDNYLVSVGRSHDVQGMVNLLQRKPVSYDFLSVDESSVLKSY